MLKGLKMPRGRNDELADHAVAPQRQLSLLGQLADDAFDGDASLLSAPGALGSAPRERRAAPKAIT